ncbi:MAG TPA: PBSX family phage terminase large subunit [Anaerolineaceae bacterium]|nr:PBSX family phage terminase large subunit [Anaerolineaceae bacterium]
MSLSCKQRIFIDEYLKCWNATQAALLAGYSERSAGSIGGENLKKPEIAAEIQLRLAESAMSADEVIQAIGEIGRADIGDFVEIDEGTGRIKNIDFGKAQKSGKLRLIRSITPTANGLKIELHDRMRALELLGKRYGLFEDRAQEQSDAESGPFYLPANAIAPSFYGAYRDICDHKHTEYVLKGGRGSTKSSFTSEVIIELIINNPDWHALITRQVKDTLRDSVFSQLQWAINYLGLADKFRCTTNPLEITYIPTGQKIYFRGGDDPLKIKSIKPRFGYINILWFEELDQFRGAEAVRSIIQSAIRGGDKAYIFKSFNPPRSRNSWVLKELEIPKPDRYVHHSTYLDVPREWLGQTFIDEAEFLKEINPSAYEHEYMGVSTGVGGLVFDNVEIRKITDEEITQFDHVLHGQDFGYFPDPAHYARCHYDAARLTLYIFGELRRWKTSNRDLYSALVDYGLTSQDMLICDSAEPKSVADLRDYGVSARGAEKGPESVRYSMKWLQSLKAIVIDNERAPYSAEEFLNYEHETDRDGNYISDYPDENNHAIDAVRYACNLIWRRRGQ